MFGLDIGKGFYSLQPNMNLYHTRNSGIILMIILTTFINSLSATELDNQQNDEPVLLTTAHSQLDFAKLGKYTISSVKLFDSNQDFINSTEVERDDEESSITERPGPSRPGAKSAKSRVRKIKHMQNFTLTVEIDGKTVTIDLTINRFLLASDYKESVISSSNREYRNVDLFATHCYYLGTVREYENSTAAISTCNGITGTIFIGDESYHIEPEQNSENCPLCKQHKIYKSSDQPPELRQFGCGLSKNHTVNQQFARRRKRALITEWPQDQDGKTRLVEVYAISDHYQYSKYGGDMIVISQRAKDIINTASLLYQPEDIYLVLVGMEIWADINKISINTPLNSTKLIADSCNYAQKYVTQHRDISLYITSQGPFDNSVVGRAYLGQMCGASACAFCADIGTTGIAGIVVAHEFGHSFGLNHDGDPPCPACGFCIMDASVGSKNLKWSTCDKNILASANTYSTFTCLNNIPQTLYDPTSASICGNGLVETGEQCDCGQAPTSECNPTCCSNTTCQLSNPSVQQCASGKCCDLPTCKFIPKYTVCRSTASVCDLIEYCSGTDHLCPSDVFKADFSPCTIAGTVGYCHTGQCNNRQNQCQIVYGPSATAADDECYTFWNAQTQYPQYRYAGNCGFVTPGDYTNYFPCAPADVFCGQAQCTGGTLQFSSASSSQGTYGLSSCTQPHFDVPISDGNLGYIPDGSPCGTGLVCQGQKCIALASATTGGTCPDCSGNGVCNSLYQCHCNVGYAPPSCNTPGDGGSLHSNPIVPLPSNISTSMSTSQSSTTSSTMSTTSSTMSSTTLSTTITISSSSSSTTTMSSSTVASDTWFIIAGVVLGIVIFLGIFYICYRCYQAPPSKSVPQQISYQDPPSRSFPIRYAPRQQAQFDPYSQGF